VNHIVGPISQVAQLADAVNVDNFDAKFGGNSSRWINHSCAPNCTAAQEGQRVFIDALRDIAVGEELFYDYGLVIDEPLTRELKANYPCWCGHGVCRGTLLASTAPAAKPRRTRAKPKG
jgi:hypothetical protein